MGRKWAVAYIDQLLASDDYGALVDLSQCLCCSPKFRSDHVRYALPQEAFVFVEGLIWEAQSTRSGACNYFEATRFDRQLAMKSALQIFAPPSFSEWYERGMLEWKDELKMSAVSEWMDENESVLTTWLRELARGQKTLVYELTA